LPLSEGSRTATNSRQTSGKHIYAASIDEQDQSTAAATRKGTPVARLRPGVGNTGELDVPDPYYGGPEGFDHVLDIVDAACPDS
jgi:protein-tyrosine-phosphatase